MPEVYSRYAEPHRSIVHIQTARHRHTNCIKSCELNNGAVSFTLFSSCVNPVFSSIVLICCRLASQSFQKPSVDTCNRSNQSAHLGSATACVTGAIVLPALLFCSHTPSDTRNQSEESCVGATSVTLQKLPSGRCAWNACCSGN